MNQLAFSLAVIIMTGVFLTLIAWQVLAIARTAVANDTGTEISNLGDRLAALEALHDDTHLDNHRQVSP